MKKNITLIAVAGLILLFGSCAKEDSSNVNQDSIYSIYELFYNKKTDKTTAQATYRFGGPTGTLLQLNSPAGVTFNGDKLSYNSITGVHKKEYAGSTNSGKFSYTDLDANTFANTIGTIDPFDFPTVDTIKNTGAYTFKWTGNPVGENETISLTINGTQQANIEIVASSSKGSTELIIPMNKLQNVGLGNAVCVLQRTFAKSNIDQATSKGGRQAVWYRTQKNIYISN